MSPAGRPKLENAKNFRMEVRLTKEEKDQLERIIEKRPGITMSFILRNGINLFSMYDDFPEIEEILNALTIAQGHLDDAEIKERALQRVRAEANSLVKKLS